MSVIQKWYEDRTLFVTGATGFMGKVLLEKILRCLPGIQKVIILVRTKRGLDPAKRIENLSKLYVFERLLKMDPKAFDKVTFVEGDLSQVNLGLKESDKKMLSQVTIVFHMAATLRLESGVKDAVIANTLATKSMLDLCCAHMKKIECFVHLSTAFCYPDKAILDEFVHKPHSDPYEIIKYVQTENEAVLDAKKMEIISPHPNAYTFSKRLAEWIVKDYSKKLPVVITRPSIVIPAFKEPVPGWVDSLNGPIGVMAAAGKGVIRSMLCNETYSAQVVPVDFAINGLIAIPPMRHHNKQELPVYNLNIPNNLVDMKWGELLEWGQRLVNKYPFEWTLWYPDGAIRTNVYVHWMVMILFQWIPAVFLDIIFFIIRRERFMIRVQKKIKVGMEFLQYFTLRKWQFITENFMTICKNINEVDDEIFYCLNCTYHIEEYFTNVTMIIKKVMFKEDRKNVPIVRIYFKFLYILHVSVIYYFYYFMASLFLRLFGLEHLLTLKYWYDF